RGVSSPDVIALLLHAASQLGHVDTEPGSASPRLQIHGLREQPAIRAFLARQVRPGLVPRGRLHVRSGSAPKDEDLHVFLVAGVGHNRRQSLNDPSTPTRNAAPTEPRRTTSEAATAHGGNSASTRPRTSPP